MCRMVAANVGIGILPESAARRQAKTSDIHLVHLTDKWALRDLKICVRSLDLLPSFARDLVKLIVDDARDAREHEAHSRYRMIVSPVDARLPLAGTHGGRNGYE